MNQKSNPFLLLLLSGILLFIACNRPNSDTAKEPMPIDKLATAETKALYTNLHSLSGKQIMFGHQDALAYGVGRNHPDSSYCDVKDVTGSYPALYGWDIGHIADSSNIDSVPFIKMVRLIKESYARGGVTTISWHELNPKPGRIMWSENPTPAKMLPGGVMHEEFKNKLNLVGDFFNQLKDENGKCIPVIFRPFHEHNGDWFWWGTHNCTEAEYIALWQYTVNYLSDTLNIHQLLYATSPDRSRMKSATETSDFLYAYPGDEYVDIIGLDNYWDIGGSAGYNKNITRQEQDSLFINSLRTIARIAAEKGKIPALTETGSGCIKENDWFTKRILEPLKNDSLARGIAYFLVWRNGSKAHFFAPYPGHPASQDFINFRNDEMILFEDELPAMYKESSVNDK